MADQRQDSQLLPQPPEPLSHEKSKPPSVGISDCTSLNSLESVESSLVQPSSITKAPSIQSFMSRDTSSPRRSEYFLKSDAFSAATKLEVKRLAGENCWACGSGPVHICHIIAKEDSQAQLWNEFGLITFPLTSVGNAVPLCPLCRNQFDLVADPGFLFIPTDLQYFIQFELKDRERRRADMEQGVISKREIPTRDIYRAHQVKQGIISADSVGGLYLPIFLKHYFHCNQLPFDVLPYFSRPKQWHGAPLATFRRAFPVLGSARLNALSRQTRLELQQLRDLYFLTEEEDSPSMVPGSIPTPRPQADDKKRKRSPDDDTRDDTGSKKPKPTARGDAAREKGDRSGEAGTHRQCPATLRDSSLDWVLGPDIPTEEAVRRYAPVLARSSLSSTLEGANFT
ncbi:pyruvate dehydrogenase kinase [Histoplasma ohiense]|nr:pyruvate dehydrogenase kinase [Histoplasma ohiense (nom. inval.)]